MAGLETVHRIVEKLEVAGEKAVYTAFDKLGGLAGLAAKALGLTSTKGLTLGKTVGAGANQAGQALAQMGGQGQAAGKQGAKSVESLTASLTKALLASQAVAKVFSFVVGKAKALLQHGLAVNGMYDDMEDKLAGLIVATTDWGKTEDPVAQFEKSAQGASALLGEFERTAMRTATPLQHIADLGAQIEPVWTAMGKSQLDIAKTTDEAAAAAKVLGRSTDQVWASMQRIIMTGKAGRRDDVGRLILAKAQIKASDTAEQRATKLEAALKKIGAPVAEVAKGTDDALQRWKTLSDSVLRRVTKPVYDKIGVVVQSIVDYTEAHAEAVDKVVFFAEDLTGVLWDAAKGVWDVGTGIVEWVASFEIVRFEVGRVWDYFKAIWRIVDAVGHAWKVVSESVAVLNDPGRGMGKLNTLTEGFYLKLLKVVQAFRDILMKIADIVVPDFIEDRLPDSAKKFLKSVKDVYGKGLDDFVNLKERQVAAAEKKFGLDPSTDIGKAEARARLSRDEQRKFLAGLVGTKRPLLEIKEVNIQQDFRDQDPDRVMIEFKKDLESLGERALQSMVGGSATVFGPGGST